MTGDLVDRYAPLTGLLVVLLLIASMSLLATLDYRPPARRAIELFSRSPRRLALGANLGSLAAFFMIPFSGTVFRALREAEGRDGWLPAVALGGGIAFAIVLALGIATYWAGFARAATEGGLSPEGATILYDLYSDIIGGASSIMLAAFIGATALAAWRSGLFPPWLGWSSLLITLGLLTTYHYLFQPLTVLWLGVVSVLLYLQGAGP